MSTTQLEPAENLGDLVGELKTLLNQHLSRHQELLTVVERKRDALVRMDRDEIERTLLLEQEAVAAAGLAEQRRLELTRAIAGAVGSASGAGMRLAELAGQLREEDREELLETREGLRDVADRLERLNRLNRTMTQQALGSFQMFISLLAGKDPQARTYNRRGTVGDEPSSLLVDRQA